MAVAHRVAPNAVQKSDISTTLCHTWPESQAQSQLHSHLQSATHKTNLKPNTDVDTYQDHTYTQGLTKDICIYLNTV